MSKPICSVEGCNNICHNKGYGRYRRYCTKHYRQFRTPTVGTRKHPPRKTLCLVEGCENPVEPGRKKCSQHLVGQDCDKFAERRLSSSFRLCSHPGCENEVTGNNRLCDCHITPHTLYTRQCKRGYRKCKVCGVEIAKGRRFCPLHRRKRKKFLAADRIRFQPCWLCGWYESVCDRHRIIPGDCGGKYVSSNIIICCPCCHRTAHLNPEFWFEKLYLGVMGGLPISLHILEIADSLRSLWELYEEKGMRIGSHGQFALSSLNEKQG